MLRRWLLYGLCTLLLLSCGEPVPVDCTPDEEQCTSETEGGFETGTVAGVTAGGAAVIALVGEPVLVVETMVEVPVVDHLARQHQVR